MLEKNALICVIVFVSLYLVMSGIFILIAAKGGLKKGKKCKFDERQIAAQGMAYEAAFWSILGYFIVYSISGAAEIVWCDPLVGGFLGIIVGVTVFVIVCVFKDAYFRPDQSAAFMVVVINLLCFSQGALGFSYLSKGTVIENGALSGDAIPLFILLMGVVIDVAFLVKRCKEKRESAEECE